MKTIVEQLDPIFKPRSIAVIGASQSHAKWGFRMMNRPARTGYRGAIYPVNRTGEAIGHFPGYKSVLDIPEAVDLAVITVPARQVPGVMKECAEKGVRGVVLITAGFAEIGPEGKILEDKVVGAARKGGIRFVGPNCMGIWSRAGLLCLSFDKAPLAGPIAFVSQSGTFGVSLSEIAGAKGYGLSKFISIGNQADLTAADYLEYLASDEETKVLVFYIEGFKDGERFMNLAREVVKKKPIIIYKAGRTAAGSKATQSHTASLAGSDEIFDAACRQAGLIRVQETLHAFDVAEVLASQPLPPGRRVAILGSGRCLRRAGAGSARTGRRHGPEPDGRPAAARAPTEQSRGFCGKLPHRPGRSGGCGKAVALRLHRRRDLQRSDQSRGLERHVRFFRPAQAAARHDPEGH